MITDKIIITSDHAGYQLKEEVKEHLESKGIQVKDIGTHSDASVDYPDFAHALANFIEKGEFDYGITICGSGNGISMAVNKHQGIRGAICWSEEISRLARFHNNANVCSLPARFISASQANKILDIFLNTEFEGGRHQKRIDKIPKK